MNDERRALFALAAAAADELRDLRDPDPLAINANRATQRAAETIEQFWLPALGLAWRSEGWAHPVDRDAHGP